MTAFQHIPIHESLALRTPLIEGVVGTSEGFGLSPFLLIVIFIGAPVVSAYRDGGAGVQGSPPLR